LVFIKLICLVLYEVKAEDIFFYQNRGVLLKNYLFLMQSNYWYIVRGYSILLTAF